MNKLIITHVRLEAISGLSKAQLTLSLEHITDVGNLDEGWLYSKEDAIRMIESDQAQFYTESKFGSSKGIINNAQRHTLVEVVSTPGHPKYLRTNPNNETLDNLLSLPRY